MNASASDTVLATSTSSGALASPIGSPSSVGSAPAIVSPSAVTPEQLDAQLQTLQAQLDAVRQARAAAEQRAFQEQLQKRKDTIARFMTELNAKDLNDLIAILREDARGTVTPANRSSAKGSKPVVGRRNGPIPAETRAAIIEAMKAGMTEMEGVKRFHISPASWWIIKRAAKLTGRGIGGHAQRMATAKAKSKSGKAPKAAA